MEIKGKSILIFYPYAAPKHCGDAIVEELRNRGGNVVAYNERPSQSTISKIFIRLLKKRVPQLFAFYIDKIIKKHKNAEFDYILVIRGEAFNRLAISKLKKAYPRAYFILSLWDILETNDIRDIFDCFDSVFSFDQEDVKNNPPLVYRPMFYIPEYENIKQTKPKYDVLFIGTLHSNRYEIIQRIKVALQKQKLIGFFYLYIPSRLLFLKNWITHKQYATLRDVRFIPAGVFDSLQLLQDSKCLIDINYPGQKSISMRAFEAIAAKKKYITTNANITQCLFYNKNNILVVNENDIIIPQDFVNSPYVDVPKETYSLYTVSAWIDDVFQIN